MDVIARVAICLGKNAIFHAHTKYIDVRYHFIREVLEDGLVLSQSVYPRHNISYVYRWWELLSVTEPPWPFKWDVAW